MSDRLQDHKDIFFTSAIFAFRVPKTGVQILQVAAEDKNPSYNYTCGFIMGCYFIILNLVVLVNNKSQKHLQSGVP